VDLRPPIGAFLDWQLLPLTPEVQQPQDVVEDRMQGQFEGRSSAADRQVRQDKFLELLAGQNRWYPLPLLGLRHFDHSKDRGFDDSARLATIQHRRASQTNSAATKTRNQLYVLTRC